MNDNKNIMKRFGKYECETYASMNMVRSFILRHHGH